MEQGRTIEPRDWIPVTDASRARGQAERNLPHASGWQGGESAREMTEGETEHGRRCRESIFEKNASIKRTEKALEDPLGKSTRAQPVERVWFPVVEVVNRLGRGQRKPKQCDADFVSERADRRAPGIEQVFPGFGAERIRNTMPAVTHPDHRARSEWIQHGRVSAHQPSRFPVASQIDLESTIQTIGSEVVGAHSAAGSIRCLVDDRLVPALAQADGAGESGHAGTDDGDLGHGCGTQVAAWRSCHSLKTRGLISEGLISLRPPQKTFV